LNRKLCKTMPPAPELLMSDALSRRVFRCGCRMLVAKIRSLEVRREGDHFAIRSDADPTKDLV
jgi:hypothetical protein